MLDQLFSLFFPRQCAVCGQSLIPAERLICMGCRSDLPKSGYWQQEENILTHLFREFQGINIEHASSFLCYAKESPYHALLHRLKYKEEAYIGTTLGQWFGVQIKEAPFYQTVDTLIPVPLHPQKEKKRGYNQSRLFAQGIADQTGWALETEVLKRIRHTSTQTKLNREERQINVAGAFALKEKERISGKHILLVDDVLTTGSTLHACASTLLQARECKVSVAAIAYIQ